MSPVKNTQDMLTSGAATAALAGLGGAIAPLAGLPVGAAAVLCGLPVAAAAAVADRHRGFAAAFPLSMIGIIGFWLDHGSPAAMASSAFVMTSAAATLMIATKRRRRHEKTVVGLERLTHQILGDATRRPEHVVSIPADVRDPHEATLIALHEFGRRVATHVSLETLVPTILTATKSLTGCAHAAIYFWDARERVLRDGLAPRSRDVGSYAPDPTKGAAAWVVATQQVYTTAAAGENAELAKATAGDARRPAAIAPLIAGNELVGLLIADEPDAHHPTSAALMCNLANIAVLGLRNARLLNQLTDAARRDPLTGLIDRSALKAAVGELVDDVAGTAPIGLIAGDIDDFHEIAGKLDDHAADTMLQEIGRLWRAAMPNDALAFRMDRAAFLAVVPQCEGDRLRDLVEAVRESIATHSFSTSKTETSFTASIGIADWRREAQTFDDARRLANEAQRFAKTAGGNRVAPAEASVTNECVRGRT